MKIVIPGGSGQIGTLIARDFSQEGHEVTVLSRQILTAPWRIVQWDAKSLDSWVETLDGADAVINLAGRSVNCRYNARHRLEIMNSRVESTRLIGKAIANCAHPPKVWLQASTATIYAHRYDKANDEATGILGGSEVDASSSWKFSTDVAKSWENAANEVSLPKTRLVLLRSAMTMSPDRGGVFDVLLRLVRFGLGGQHGDGKQFVSWIHGADFIRALYWLIDSEIDGPVNLSSTQPLQNVEFMSQLRSAWGARLGLPSTRAMLELGAWAIGTETELVLKSRMVLPSKLIDSGFKFEFPNWASASIDLCRRWRERFAH